MSEMPLLDNFSSSLSIHLSIKNALQLLFLFQEALEGRHA